MKKTASVLLIISTLCFGRPAFAQEPQPRLADYLIAGNFSIPAIISSQMFQRSFDGIYEMNFSINRHLGGNFFAGLGYQSYNFENDEDLTYAYFNASIPYDTHLKGNGLFLRLSKSRFFSKTGYLSYGANLGYLFSRYTNVNPDTSVYNRPYGAQSFNVPYIQPEFSANFIVDKTLSFAVILSYTTLFSNFDPKAPRFNQFGEISSASNNYVMSWINFGFSFNVLLNTKRKK